MSGAVATALDKQSQQPVKKIKHGASNDKDILLRSWSQQAQKEREFGS